MSAAPIPLSERLLALGLHLVGLVFLPPPLAQVGPERTDFFRRWAESMRRSRGSGWSLLGVVVVLVGLFFLLRWLSERGFGRARRARIEPMRLFHALAERHQLEREEVQVLAEAAAAENLPDPAILFARPSVFDRCLQRRLHQIEDEQLREEAGIEVERLRTKIFGALTPDADSPGRTASANPPPT